ncbi:MAG TPA: hypothetical protein VKB75_01600 [Jatrophihabitans sp.]|nr:hypothetical protein [Jatrophihabitans sp.]
MCVDRTALAAVAALQDDVRRSLYEHVRVAGAPVTREAAADAVGISRKLAAFHLDKLVELGLLQSGFGPPRARRVGRAPRVYEPAPVAIAIHVPHRAPELLAGIFVEAVTQARVGDDTERAARRVAHSRGVAVGSQARSVRPGRVGVERAVSTAHAVLAEQGFEPYRSGDAVRLRNCPFHPLAAQAPALVCGLNRDYLAGVVEGLGADGAVVAELAPRPGECCVQISPARR